MKALEQHHDIALMLLVARSVPGGLPWDVQEDRELIHKERVLWASLTPIEQETEQRALQDLWKHKGELRTIQANPTWGQWAQNLGAVAIPDSAFGPATDDLRPEALGPPNDDDYPGFARVVQWLFHVGFRVTRLTFGATARHRHSRLGILHMPIPPHRIDKETDRLADLLVREFPHLNLVPRNWVDEGVAITSSYDAVMGMAYLYLQGVNDAALNAENGH